MDKKTIIKIAVIVVCFGGSGFVLYNGFFKNNGPPPAYKFLTLRNQDNGEALLQGSQDLLPNGGVLDFQAINRSRFQYDIVPFPKLDKGREVGISVNNLVAAPASP